MALALKEKGISHAVAEAEKLERDVLSLRADYLGADHPDTLRTKANLAGTMEILGRLEVAEAMLKEVLTAQERVLGRGHSDTEATRLDLAELLKASAPKRCKPLCVTQ